MAALLQAAAHCCVALTLPWTALHYSAVLDAHDCFVVPVLCRHGYLFTFLFPAEFFVPPPFQSPRRSSFWCAREYPFSQDTLAWSAARDKSCFPLAGYGVPKLGQSGLVLAVATQGRTRGNGRQTTRIVIQMPSRLFKLCSVVHNSAQLA